MGRRGKSLGILLFDVLVVAAVGMIVGTERGAVSGSRSSGWVCAGEGRSMGLSTGRAVSGSDSCSSGCKRDGER